MPENITDEQLQVLFADLRADTTVRVRPPGARAARRTVRHRRTVQSVAAGATVLAAAGGLVIAGNLIPARHDVTQLNRATHGPAPDRTVLQAWSDEAATAVGSEPQVPDSPFNKLGDHGPVDGNSASSHRVIRGQYLVRLSCIGSGVLAVVIRTGRAPADGGNQPEDVSPVTYESVSCRAAGTAAGIQVVSVAVPQDGMFAVEVRPDASTAGRAGFAYRAHLRPGEQQSLRGSVSTRIDDGAPSSPVLAMSEFLEDATSMQHDRIEPGRYVIRMSCVGTGQVRFSARVYPDSDGSDLTGGTRIMQVSLPCGLTSLVGEHNVIKSGGGALVIDMEPNTAAEGQSAAGFRLYRA